MSAAPTQKNKVNRRLKPLLLRSDEASVLLACSLRTIQRLCQCGTLPSIRLGRVLRLRLSDIEAFVNAKN